MFLLKCKIRNLDSFQAIFKSISEAEKYVESLCSDSLEDWSIHPLFVQNSVKSMSHTSNPWVTVSVQRFGDTNVRPYKDNISLSDITELVFKDMDFTNIRKIIIFPHA